MCSIKLIVQNKAIAYNLCVMSSMSCFSSAVKFDIEKFDGRINFGMWQIQVKDVLIQSGLHKALTGKVSGMEDDKWEEMDLRVASAIRLCLAKNVLANVHNMKTAKDLCEKLEGLYQAKGISNRLLLKEKFHNLRMDDSMKVSDHLSALNGIISELEAIGVKIEDEDKALRLIWSLSSSYGHIKPVLIKSFFNNKYAILNKLQQHIQYSKRSRMTDRWCVKIIIGNS
ncbi:hypothetical protein RIF29_40772 [Crotalaria pallida]|uniref:Uncharacterized protein n=1 Tax=Crotalaria pallida TaxID=3830 RepID=A0AAN9E6R4_CROPI